MGGVTQAKSGDNKKHFFTGQPGIHDCLEKTNGDITNGCSPNKIME